MAKIDYSKIFIKDACPTAIGGQAVMEGVMMQGPDRVAIAMRLPSGELYLKTKKKKKTSKKLDLPLVRGVVAFVNSLVNGMGTLMESADILEAYAPEEYYEEPSKFEKWVNSKFGEKAAWNIMMTVSVVIALLVTIVGFVIFPTWVVNVLTKWVKSVVLLNLVEGVLRIVLFVLYVLAIRRMEEIKNLFRYHGAEHKSIHCFENDLPLTPENADEFYTLHPRCGTSFLVFVLIISLLLFSFLGWPSLLWRILSRLALMPVIAGLSYEVLKWAGRCDGTMVKVLSYPGLMLQKLTTAEPTKAQLEVALLSLKAVLVDPDAPIIEGFVDADGNLKETFDEANFIGEKAEAVSVGEGNPGEEIDLRGKNVPEFNEPSFDEVFSEPLTEMMAAIDEVAEKATVAVPRFVEEQEDIGECPETIKDALEWGQNQLGNIENGRLDATKIFSHLTGMNTSRIITRGGDKFDQQAYRDYKKMIDARLSGIPMQYIIGVQSFMGLDFKVNPSVLIPRYDTEVLAEKVINIIGHKNWEAPQVLDMCTGSGALGISIAHKYPEATVTLTDVSQEALNVAIGNAQLNKVNRSCQFLLGDMFEALPDGKQYDCIVCNPPYVQSAVIGTLATEVKDHEPMMALDGGADGLNFYRILAEKAGSYIKKGGILALEIGADQDAAVQKLLKDSGDYAAVIGFKDLNGLDRVVIAERK